MTEIADRLALVHARIRAAEVAAGRAPEQVKLLAVSKTMSPTAIRAAYAAGQRDFGENYVQELVQKADLLHDLPDVRWHFIGHLQRNKVKVVATRLHMIHTVDSPKLAAELDKRLEAAAEPLATLVEVNVGREAQKSGVSPEALEQVLQAVSEAKHLRLAGLMTVPPFTDDPADARPYFDRLRELRERFGGRSVLPELSMGMSADLEQAVAAGATWVRVGTAVFGPRGRALP
ncbi:MAG: YggS family pyridoxal phosphate-dependent enzyme [Polyangiaceae bacterium]